MSTEFSKLVKANCSDHAIEVETWDEDFIYIGLWSPVSAKYYGRLRRAWLALRGEEIFDNDCVISREQAVDLQVALSDAANACHALKRAKAHRETTTT